jgi:hypothetical protein
MLPNELTFSTFLAAPPSPENANNIPHAEQSVVMGNGQDMQVVPGGIGGRPNFISLWNEYYAAAPDFGRTFPARGGALEFQVPDNNAMRVESVDVKLSLGGDAAQAMSHLRILLVSPDGTYSDLNNNWIDAKPDRDFSVYQFDGYFSTDLTDADPDSSFGDPGSLGSETGTFDWTFNTNRSWGERADNRIVFDPVTGEPAVDKLGQFTVGNIPGEVLRQGWHLVIENWDNDSDFSLQGVELDWHGSPVAANSQRIQGFVGIDENGDDKFNYSRVNTTTTNFQGDDPNIIRLGELVNTPDLTQESFAANQTVTVRRTSDNTIVDQFVTGHDGNFYFDLVPDDYIISVEDPQGRALKDDTVTPSQYLQHYKQEWHITPDWFKVWDHANGNASEVVVDQNGTPVPWVDDNGNQVTYGMTGINFLLDAGDVQHSTFTGTVYADTNGDGFFNGVDVKLPGVTVFGDVNANGVLDEGEVTAVSDANGQYVLAIDTSQDMVMKVGVIPPAKWTVTNPTAGSYSLLAIPGVQTPSLDFFLKPAANNAGGGGVNDPGYLLGSIYIDANNNGTRDAFEQGAAGVQVFLDDNGDGLQDGTEQIVTANQFGSYAFTNVAAGQHTVRLVSPGVTFQQTQPQSGAPYVVNLTASSTISGLVFGIRDAAIYDFGDLPAKYGATTLAENGARHLRGLYFLGSGIDGELDGVPSADATGDDAIGDDEDGVSVVTLNAGGSATLTVTASRYNGYLQAWFDWNDDGDFNDANERVVTNRLLDQGANSVTISVPSGLQASQVFARFRYGEFGINSPFGAALTGEVEDYAFPINPQAPPVVGMPSDFNQDGVIDGFDFLLWQRNLGTPTGATQAQGSSNSDGDVDRQDMIDWYLHYGQSQSVATASAASNVALAAESSGDESQPLTAAFTQGGSAPLAAMSYSSVSSPAMRPSYRPPDQLATSDESTLASLLADNVVVNAADKDAALDDMFQSHDLLETAVDSATGIADGDEAFALLGSSL